MQFLYKSRKKIPESKDSAISTILAEQLEKGYLIVQGKWAQWMTKKTANISPTNLLVMWVFFIAFSTGYSMYLIVASLSGVATTDSIITPIVKPSKLPESDDDTIRKENSFISTNEFEKINRFRIYMDSLARSPTGKKRYDSIVNNPPGLLDSLATIENYYQSNFKNYTHGKKN
ncbi:hypothetical protein [Flavobacterium sp. ZS1P14]|uniref:hypothetical protein n=1 Tax=Flavobacterium sp. ZS1P14 TaxID=3401729 RepID=UPI003AAC7CE2